MGQIDAHELVEPFVRRSRCPQRTRPRLIHHASGDVSANTESRADSLNNALAFWGSSDHDEVTTRIIKHGGAYTSRSCWLRSKHHSQRFQSFVFFLNILNRKRCRWYPCIKKSFLELLGGDSRVAVWLKKELNIVWPFR